ncbi:hypothetical protein HELRODRAFT_188877 [Helobdella robusta]|uniref:Ig-like domain-containing protein n=1 Tax=Helobdella robusta TaxID=6412 RepID=T1FQF4_HELRO|nr:hypothetical protein HELRODRAFT_188877 [Helobdella robusta]ESN98684.1 hypothetical protein HELRODRAFT_188877 [Helobdella robusta]
MFLRYCTILVLLAHSTIQPDLIKKIEMGTEMEFSCPNLDTTMNISNLMWFNPDNQVVGGDSSRNYYHNKTTNCLVMTARSQVNDSGLYTCSVLYQQSGENHTVPRQSSLLQEGNSREIIASTTTSATTYTTTTSSPATDLSNYKNSTIEIGIYIMPSYFTEGMILLGLNMGLGSLLVVLNSYSFYKERKSLKGFGTM